MGSQIIPSQKSMLLEPLLEFEQAVQKPTVRAPSSPAHAHTRPTAQCSSQARSCAVSVAWLSL
jgi:hypothetical protein